MSGPCSSRDTLSCRFAGTSDYESDYICALRPLHVDKATGHKADIAQERFMFGKKSRTKVTSAVADIWNGWTAGLIRLLTQLTHFEVTLESLWITHSFDARELALL